MATPEMDQLMKKAITLLHSSHPNSATELRMMLDEIIKQRFGPEKMLINTLSKKHFENEKNFPGRAPTPTAETGGESSEIAENQRKDNDRFNLVPEDSVGTSHDINMSTNEGQEISSSMGTVGPITIPDDDETMITNVEDDSNLKDFGDLNCCVCGEIMFTATNRLIECSKCGALYHQECHKPPITNEEASEDQQLNWLCDTCFSQPSTSKAAGIVVSTEDALIQSTKNKPSATSSRSSSSSNSSSPFFGKQEVNILGTPTQTTSGILPVHNSNISLVSSSSGKHDHKNSSKSLKDISSSKSEKLHISNRKSSHNSTTKSKSSKNHESTNKRKSK